MYKLENSKYLKKLGWQYIKRGYYEDPNDVGILAAHNILYLRGLTKIDLEILIDFILKNKEQPKEFWVKDFSFGKTVMKDCPVWVVYDGKIITENEYFDINYQFNQEIGKIRKSTELSDDEKIKKCRYIRKPQEFSICLNTIKTINDLNDFNLLIKEEGQ